jgi:long-chain acyl-CoA synthetase
MRLSTLQSLVECLPRYGRRQAVGLRQEFGVRWWSYQRLHEEARRVAARLRELGVQKGDSVLLWSPNCPEWAGFVLGAALRGVVVVPVDEGTMPETVRRFAEAVDATLLVHGLAQEASAIGVPTLSILETSDVSVPSDEELIVPVDPDDPAIVIYTSGTTTRPRGVVLTHRNLVAQIAHFHRWEWLVRLRPTRLLMLSPLSHVQGLVLGICAPLAIGISVLYNYSVSPAHVIRTIRQNRVRVLVAVPRVQHLLIEALQQMPVGRDGITLKERLQTIRWLSRRQWTLFWAKRAAFGRQFWVLLVGGATLSLADEQFWNDCGCFLAHGYGLTETAAIVSFNLVKPFSRRVGSIGKPWADQVVDVAEDGEILVRGPNITPGYLGDGDDGQVFVDDDGFLHTGDLVRRDRIGRLYFLGRKKDVIVTGEAFNVYPHEVENVLNQMPGVRDAVAVGVTLAEYEEVHAALLLDDGTDPASIIQGANARLEPHQRIRGWTVWPEADFPRSSLMKVKRKEVVAAMRLHGRSATEPPIAAPARAVPAPISLEMIQATNDRREKLRLISRYLCERSAEELASDQVHLVEDLGLSSLDVIELLTLLEKHGRLVWDNPVVPEEATLAYLHSAMSGSREIETPALFTRPPVSMNNPLVRAIRAVLSPIVLPIWFSRLARLEVRGVERIADLCPPFIVAAAHHEHGSDVMAIRAALPRHLRKKLLVVTAQQTFQHYLDPDPDVPLKTRMIMGGAYRLGMSLFVPFTLWPHYGTTRVGLFETCQFIERGSSPVVFPEGDLLDDGYAIMPGVGLTAVQTQAPVLPVQLEGNDGMDFSSRRRDRKITVHFGTPIATTPEMSAGQVTLKVREAFKKLSCQGDEHR